MNYKEKYLKYKIKYIELKEITEKYQNEYPKSRYLQMSNIQYGGKKTNKKNEFEYIIKFLKTAEKEEIKNELYDIIQNKDYCPNILGEGVQGIAYIPEINKTMLYKNGKNKLHLPIVIKETRSVDNPKVYSDIDIINNILYISGFYNITTEVLILMFIRNIWNKTVHLPLLLGYNTCSKSKVVDKIITLKFGLDEKYEKDLTGKFYNDTAMFMKPRNENINIFSSYLGTLQELFNYIYLNKNIVQLNYQMELNVIYQNCLIIYQLVIWQHIIY